MTTDGLKFIETFTSQRPTSPLGCMPFMPMAWPKVRIFKTTCMYAIDFLNVYLTGYEVPDTPGFKYRPTSEKRIKAYHQNVKRILN